MDMIYPVFANPQSLALDTHVLPAHEAYIHRVISIRLP